MDLPIFGLTFHSADMFIDNACNNLSCDIGLHLACRAGLWDMCHKFCTISTWAGQDSGVRCTVTFSAFIAWYAYISAYLGAGPAA